jgi:hypothetical protein
MEIARALRAPNVPGTPRRRLRLAASLDLRDGPRPARGQVARPQSPLVEGRPTRRDLVTSVPPTTSAGRLPFLSRSRSTPVAADATTQRQ